MSAEAIEGPVERFYPLVLADYRIHLNEAVRDLAVLRKVKTEKSIKNMEGRDVKEDPDYATDNDGPGAESAGSSEDSAGSGEGLE